jgi:hypothetical protein
MKILDFDFDPGLLDKFLEFPRRHNASDPNWMPDSNERHLLADKEPRAAKWRNFLALDGGEVRGRAAAIINPRICDETGQPYGQVGFFECVNDPSVAEALMDSAVEWLCETLRTDGKILAPMNFDTWHSYRFRTAGFGEPTFFMEPCNPPHYPKLLEGLGFSPVSRYITKSVRDLTPLLEVWKPFHRAMRSKGFAVRSFNPAQQNDELSLVYRLSLEMFRENLFFTEIPEAEFRALYAGAAGSLDPDLFLFLLDPQGDAAGFCFAIPDHRQPRTVNVKTFGILPSLRREGLGAGLACEMYLRFQSKGILQVNHCLMRAGNRADNFDGGLGEITREYALFTRTLSR